MPINRPVPRSEFDLLKEEMKRTRAELLQLRNQHAPTVPVYIPDYPDDAVEGQHAFRDLKPKYFRDGIWHPRLLYVTPVSPADEPSDFDEQGTDDFPAWESPWGNIGPIGGDPVDPTAFTIFYGHLWVAVNATGGEGDPGSLLFTLPETHRPGGRKMISGRLGLSGDRIGAIDIYPSGEVVFVGSAVLS